MSKRTIVKTCPECLGTRYQIGVDGLEPCETCEGTGLVEEEVNVIEEESDTPSRFFARVARR